MTELITEGKQMANKHLYIGDLRLDTTEDDIRALLESFGPIGEIRIIGDKGFGFVEIPEEQMAAAIEAINGKAFRDRTLTVNEARPKLQQDKRYHGHIDFAFPPEYALLIVLLIILVGFFHHQLLAWAGSLCSWLIRQMLPVP